MAWAAFNINNAVYDSKSFNYSAQESGTALGHFFKSDGTKLYILGVTSTTVYQYSCSTPYDVSTASYDSKSVGVGTQDTNPHDIFFSPDGTKMYIEGAANDFIYQYTLSTPWDVSTATYASKSFSIASQETNALGLYIRPDGAKFYIIGSVNKTVYQYSMGTPFDISTGSYDSKSFSVSSQSSGVPIGLFFRDDGTKFWTQDVTNKVIYQYSLTAWDVSTASYDTITFSTGTQLTGTPGTMYFKISDGSKMYLCDRTNTTLFQYTTYTPASGNSNFLAFM